jgi:hypothetical protein
MIIVVVVEDLRCWVLLILFLSSRYIGRSYHLNQMEYCHKPNPTFEIIEIGLYKEKRIFDKGI